MSEIKAMPLKGLTDLPAFGEDPGYLRTLQNMRPMENGYVEARGGLDKLRISGGTAANPIAGNMVYLGAHEHSSSTGWVINYNATGAPGFIWGNGVSNQQYLSYFRFFMVGNAGAGAAGDACYFGSDFKFSALIIAIGGQAVWTSATTTWEYWNGAAWTALTMTVNPDFANPDSTTGQPRLLPSWSIPTDWVPTSVGETNNSGFIYKYWVRVRLAAVVGLITLPVNSHQPVRGEWFGVREHYVYIGDPGSGALSGQLMRYGVNGTTTSWLNVMGGLRASRARMASYRGSLFLVNGNRNYRWDGAEWLGLGLLPPGGTVTATAGAGAGPAFLGAGIWNYAVALGRGPQQNVGSTGVSPGTLYGFSAGLKVSTYPITTVAGQNVTIDWTGMTYTGEADEILIFRSQDLTNVDVAKRPSMPMFLRMTIGKDAYATQFVGTTATTWVDDGQGDFPTSPPVELRAFSTEKIGQNPPEGADYVCVHQNRLVLGFKNGDIYWSEPFQMNVFNQVTNVVRLNKSHGGQLMGMIEFQDQVVALTEEQVWGLTNLGQDVPQLYPIHTGIGGIAPDALAAGDGLLFIPSQDGIYAWDGSPQIPRKISKRMKAAFGKMTFELHGGSRAIVHNRMYEIRLMAKNETTTGTHYRWDFDTGEWSTVSHGGSLNLYPLAAWHAPLGHADAGVIHPIYGQAHLPMSNKAIYVGEMTTQDDSNNYDCVADVHFTIPAPQLFTGQRAMFFYVAADGWATPVISNQNTAGIGTDIAAGGIVTGAPDVGTDYSVIAGTFKEVSRGASDIVVRFSATTAASGTVNRQKLFGAVLEGRVLKIRRGGV